MLSIFFYWYIGFGFSLDVASTGYAIRVTLPLVGFVLKGGTQTPTMKKLYIKVDLQGCAFAFNMPLPPTDPRFYDIHEVEWADLLYGPLEVEHEFKGATDSKIVTDDQDWPVTTFEYEVIYRRKGNVVERSPLFTVILNRQIDMGEGPMSIKAHGDTLSGALENLTIAINYRLDIESVL